jgi:predicted nuclease of restriction endonuclease-like (RecB) superfamily
MIELSKKIIDLIEQARKLVVRTTNTAMIYTYYSVGKIIVEEWQQGKQKAVYGTQLLEKVSADLTKTFGKGFSVDNLENMRKFYLVYSAQIFISENPSRILENHLVSEMASRKLPSLFLSWSHYVFLSKVENEAERKFYEIEALTNNWGLKELKRQFNTGLYERLALSRDKQKVLELSEKGHIVETSSDVIKDPLVLEFLGLEEKAGYSETELETAIINQIETFMLELGKGFFFGGRQVRFTFDEEHYRVDLVFYNRILKCFVLIDLKIGKLSHQDLGQMQMYVNYYDRFEKHEGENPTIGIVLCKLKNKAMVEITLPNDNNQIFATQYQTIIPDKQQFLNILKQYDEE